MMPLPLVIGGNRNVLKQIHLSYPVGQGGRNIPSDVILVQHLLNAAPERIGGTHGNLKVDGLVGPGTIEAITKFQRYANCRVVDGRIDPHGVTVQALGEKLNGMNLLPMGVRGISRVDPVIQNAFLGIGPAGLPPTKLTKPTINSFNAAPPTYDKLLYTDWKYVTNQSITVSVLFGGSTTIIFHLENDRYIGRLIHRFEFKGLGVGISKGLLAGLDASFTEYKSMGSRLFRGPFGSNPLPEEDLERSCTILSAGVGTGIQGAGITGQLVFFRGTGIITVTATAVLATAGESINIPGAGAMMFFGTVENKTLT
jgi:hypothetical protein